MRKSLINCRLTADYQYPLYHYGLCPAFFCDVMSAQATYQFNIHNDIAEGLSHSSMKWDNSLTQKFASTSTQHV